MTDEKILIEITDDDLIFLQNTFEGLAKIHAENILKTNDYIFMMSEIRKIKLVGDAITLIEESIKKVG